LVPFDCRAAARRLEVQLAMVEADRRADEIGDDFEQAPRPRGGRIDRILALRALDAPDDRTARTVARP
jgi:hypothetical protein